MLDRQLVEEVAADLGTEPGLVEKEWHVVRAIGVVAALDPDGARPVFSGGTSLSVGWGLIKRFSEDADFKVAMPEAANPSQGRAQRRKFRERVLAALAGADFRLIGDDVTITTLSVKGNHRALRLRQFHRPPLRLLEPGLDGNMI